MPPTSAKPRRLQLVVSEADHSALVSLAAGQPLGPTIVARALRPDPTHREALAALERWAASLRGSTSKAPALRLLAELARLVRDA